MIAHYTHICMNCGPVRGGSVDGAPTTVVDGRCERCGSEAVAPMVPHDPYRDPAEEARRQLEALETFHAEIMREKDILIIQLRMRERNIRAALAAYRAMHPKCNGTKRCGKCKQADALLRMR